MADLIRSILNKFDEYQSQENAKHVRRSMAANARDGFWNGARPPLGYQTVVVERRRDKDKKKLAIDDSEAPIVRKIFDLYIQGDGQAGPMGVKKIVSWLNGRGYAYRGKLFHVSNVDAVLRRTTYRGLHYFNQTNSRTGERRPREEWVAMEVPAIIAEEEFQAVQARLAERNPRRVPPRVVSGPTLLIGLASAAARAVRARLPSAPANPDSIATMPARAGRRAVPLLARASPSVWKNSTRPYWTRWSAGSSSLNG